MPTAWPEREPRTQTSVAKQCGGGGVTGSATEASRTKPKGGSRGLTFELSRDPRQAGLAARSDDGLVRSAAKLARRGASALERGVSPRLPSARSEVTRGHGHELPGKACACERRHGVVWIGFCRPERAVATPAETPSCAGAKARRARATGPLRGVGGELADAAAGRASVPCRSEAGDACARPFTGASRLHSVSEAGAPSALGVAEAMPRQQVVRRCGRSAPSLGTGPFPRANVRVKPRPAAGRLGRAEAR